MLTIKYRGKFYIKVVFIEMSHVTRHSGRLCSHVKCILPVWCRHVPAFCLPLEFFSVHFYIFLVGKSSVLVYMYQLHPLQVCSLWLLGMHAVNHSLAKIFPLLKNIFIFKYMYTDVTLLLIVTIWYAVSLFLDFYMNGIVFFIPYNVKSMTNMWVFYAQISWTLGSFHADFILCCYGVKAKAISTVAMTEILYIWRMSNELVIGFDRCDLVKSVTVT